MNWQLFPAKDFATHREAWDGLNRQGPNTPLLESRFVEPLIRHFGTGEEQLAIAGPLHEPVAMAIISRVKFGVWSTFQPAQAPLGLWLSATGHSLEDLLTSLSACLSVTTILFGINQQDPYFSDRPTDDSHITTIDYIQTAHIDINQTFDEYWSARGKNLRHNLKRQRNRLEREGTQIRLEVLTQPEDMLIAIRHYGELESSGWKSKEGSAIHVDNVQGRFYIDALSAFAATGQCRVYRYYYDDKLVATDLCVLGNGIIIILKTTYDETIETSSPAMLMRQEVFQQLFDDQTLRRIEFYGRVMDWHTKWSDNFRIMYHINFYPWIFLKILKNGFSACRDKILK
jgi:hypothetical protein